MSIYTGSHGQKYWHFCQIIYHFSQNIVAITNALVFTCLFILFALEKHKKSEGKKKAKSARQNSKNGLDVIFFCVCVFFQCKQNK